SATNELYRHSLHDALPICARRTRAELADLRRSHDALGFSLSARVAALSQGGPAEPHDGRVLARSGAEDLRAEPHCRGSERALRLDRKSTRLNSSHVKISYA